MAPSTQRQDGLRATTSTLAISQVCSPIIRRCKNRWSIRSRPERLHQNASQLPAGGAQERATMGRVALGLQLCVGERGHFSATPAKPSFFFQNGKKIRRIRIRFHFLVLPFRRKNRGRVAAHRQVQELYFASLPRAAPCRVAQNLLDTFLEPRCLFKNVLTTYGHVFSVKKMV